MPPTFMLKNRIQKQAKLRAMALPRSRLAMMASSPASTSITDDDAGSTVTGAFSVNGSVIGASPEPTQLSKTDGVAVFGVPPFLRIGRRVDDGSARPQLRNADIEPQNPPDTADDGNNKEAAMLLLNICDIVSQEYHSNSECLNDDESHGSADSSSHAATAAAPSRHHPVSASPPVDGAGAKNRSYKRKHHESFSSIPFSASSTALSRAAATPSPTGQQRQPLVHPLLQPSEPEGEAVSGIPLSGPPKAAGTGKTSDRFRWNRIRTVSMDSSHPSPVTNKRTKLSLQAPSTPTTTHNVRSHDIMSIVSPMPASPAAASSRGRPVRKATQRSKKPSTAAAGHKHSVSKRTQDLQQEQAPLTTDTDTYIDTDSTNSTGKRNIVTDVRVHAERALQFSVTKGIPLKTILRKKFSWKNYPELEAFLVANREEYLRHSALNYTVQQKQYNNRLTERLLELASEHGYVFDQADFTFVTVRDRIRCYFKSYVQSAKKRGVIIGYAARKAGLLTEEDIEKSAREEGHIVMPPAAADSS